MLCLILCVLFFLFFKKKLFAVSAPAPGRSFFTVGCKISIYLFIYFCHVFQMSSCIKCQVEVIHSAPQDSSLILFVQD